MSQPEPMDSSARTGETPPRVGLGLFPLLSVLLASLALLPLIALGTWMIDGSSHALEDTVKELQLAVVADASRSARVQLELARTELLILGDLLLGDGHGDDARRLELASSRVKASERIESLGVYAPDGRLIGSLSQPDMEGSPPDALPDALRAELLRRNPAVGSVRAGTGHPRLELVHAVSVGGQVRGHLLAIVGLAPLCQVLAELASDRFGDTPDAVTLLDGARRLVAHPDCTRAARLPDWSQQGVLRSLGGAVSFRVPFGVSPEFTDASGAEWLGALQSIPSLGWAVAVQVPRSRAYGSVTSMRRTLWSAVGLVGILAVLLTVLLARHLTQPIRALVGLTERLARRDFGAQVPVGQWGELSRLAWSFNRMSESLRRSEERLAAEARVRSDLSRYLAPEVVEQIVHHPEKMALGGERRHLTVLFADIANFTGIAELMAPEAVVELLNELFTIATEIVMRHGGIVDKFIGDSVMAVFGLPESHPDDARRAVAAGEDLLRWLEVGNRRWQRTYGIELRLAIGIHTGLVVAGNIGSEKRMDYTVIGDTVNVAARLERLARPGQILVSEATVAELAGVFDFEAAGLHQVSGRSEATAVFAIRTE